jgi:hypothetical protein
VALFLDPAYIAGVPHFNHLGGDGPEYFRKHALVIVGEPIPFSRQAGEGRKEGTKRVQQEPEDGFRELIRH